MERPVPLNTSTLAGKAAASKKRNAKTATSTATRKAPSKKSKTAGTRGTKRAEQVQGTPEIHEDQHN